MNILFSVRLSQVLFIILWLCLSLYNVPWIWQHYRISLFVYRRYRDIRISAQFFNRHSIWYLYVCMYISWQGSTVPLQIPTPKFSHIYSAIRKSLCTYERCWIRFSSTMMSKNLIKQLHTLPGLRFNRCLTTEYSETTARFNCNFDTDNQMYIP
jgi:hypothetical protein